MPMAHEDRRISDVAFRRPVLIYECDILKIIGVICHEDAFVFEIHVFVLFLARLREWP